VSGAPAGPAYSAPLAWRLVLLLAIALPASVFYALLRVATEAGVPYLGFTFWQIVAGAVAVGLVLLVRRTPVALSRAHLRFYAVSALFGLAIPYLALTFTSPNLPVGVLSMTLTVEPALTYLLALCLLIERFRSVRFAGLLLGILGLLLILLPQASLPSREMVPWVLLCLAVPVSWAIWSNLMAVARPPNIDSAVASFGLLVAAALILLPAVAARGELWWFDGPGGELWWLVPVFGVLNTMLWIAGFESIRVSGPVFYSLWTLLATPFTIAAGMIFFAERHSVWIWSALILLVASLWLVNRTMDAARRRT
jgi:drug/metabolite transporter (DMT)-like permease